MRYWSLILLVMVAGLIAVAGYPLVQSLQTPQQTIGKEVQQTAERILVLNISVDSAKFTAGSTIHLKATVRNTGTEEVLLEYFAGQLFEVMIRDESGRAVYVHSDKGFQRYLIDSTRYLIDSTATPQARAGREPHGNH